MLKASLQDECIQHICGASAADSDDAGSLLSYPRCQHDCKDTGSRMSWLETMSVNQDERLDITRVILTCSMKSFQTASFAGCNGASLLSAAMCRGSHA